MDLNEGPTDFDRRHNFVVSGSVLVPKTKGLMVSWVARYLSSRRFTIHDTNADPDRNGVLFDPLPEGTFSNLTDRDNFDNPTGDRRSTNFLVLTNLRPGGVPRTGQIGVRFGF